MTKPKKFGITRKELLELPMCKFSDQDKRRYSSLLIVPTKKLHDSIHCWTSYGYFTVTGCSSATITLVLDKGRTK